MGLVENKVIVVTGANSGIGRETALVLAAEGAKVVLAARRMDKLKEVEEEICAKGGEAYCVSGDVSVREDCDRIISETLEKYGRVDVLVNNAGMGDKQIPITRCSDEWWREICAVNQDSVFYMTRAALVPMENRVRVRLLMCLRSAACMPMPALPTARQKRLLWLLQKMWQSSLRERAYAAMQSVLVRQLHHFYQKMRGQILMKEFVKICQRTYLPQCAESGSHRAGKCHIVFCQRIVKSCHRTGTCRRLRL